MIKKLVSMFFCILLFISVLPYAVFAEGAVTILTERKPGVSSVSKPRPGKISEVSYKIQLNGIDSNALLFNWSVSPENQGVSVGDNGNVRISGDTKLDSFTLTASLIENPSVTDTKTVTIQAPCFYDFDNTNPASSHTTHTENGNVYMVANSDYAERYTLISFEEYMGMQCGQSTIQFKFRVPAENANATGNYVYQYYLAEGGWGTYVYIANPDAEAKTFSMKLRPSNIIFATGITYDEWHEMKIEFDYNTMKYQFYVDGVSSVVADIPANTQKATDLRFKYDIDDVTAYTGFERPPLSIADGDKSILIPTVDNRTASVRFHASSDDTFTPITWSLAEAYTGVSIDSQTGLVTVTKAANAGDVFVKATQGANEKKATLSLTRFYEDFESFSADDTPASPWNKGSFVVDGENTYLSDSAKETIRLRIPESNAGNNLVLEADIGYRNATMTLSALNSWQILAQPTNFDVFDRKNWNKLKIVFDYKNTKYWVFINETLIANQTFAALSDQTQFGFANANIDNVTIYNVSNTAPQAIHVKLSDVCAGTDAVLLYDYFDESGMPEAGTGIQWYSSDSAAGDFQRIEEANTAVLDTSGMAGKYLKAVITPAHGDEFDSSVSITGEAVEKVCRVLDMKATVEAVTVNEKAVDFQKANVTEESMVSARVKLETAKNTEKTFLLALAYYQGDKLSKTDYRVVTLAASENLRSEPLVLTAGVGDYKIFVWDSSKLVPLIKSLSFR